MTEVKKITQPVDGIEIPVSHLDSTHTLYCNDQTYRKVKVVDYVYDIDAATMSREYAAVYCEGDHKQLVRGHVYVYTGLPQINPVQEKVELPAKKKKKSQMPSSNTPDEVA